MNNRSPARPRWLGVITMIVIGCTAVIGCAGPPKITDRDIQTILDRYEDQSRLLAERRARERQRGIVRLDPGDPSQPFSQRRISAHLDNAYLDVVVERLGINYVLRDGISLKRRISARFEDTPLPQAVTLLLQPAGLQAVLLDETMIIARSPEVPLQLTAEDDFVFHKKQLRFADTRQLEPLLGALLLSSDSDSDDYDTDDDDDSSDSGSASQELSFAALHAENAVLLKGPSTDVRNAIDILDTVDSGGEHILIEILVLKFSADHLLSVGNRISNGANGEFSDIGIDWSNLVGDTITFTNVAGAANNRMFTAAINLLLREDYARVIARPYLATISGTPASIAVVEDRYVTSFSPNGDDVSLEQVTSGITVTIQPFQLPEEQIRLDLAISSSQFIPTLENISVARSRTDTNSMVRIGAGESLVIGGLIAEQSSEAASGVPGLRNLPAVGGLFGERQETSVRQRLLIYMTPYLWQPGLEAPGGLSDFSNEFIQHPEN